MRLPPPFENHVASFYLRAHTHDLLFQSHVNLQYSNVLCRLTQEAENGCHDAVSFKCNTETCNPKLSRLWRISRRFWSEKKYDETLPSAAKITHALEEAAHTPGEEEENNGESASDKLVLQRKKLEKLKRIASNKRGELRTKESWLGLLCIVVMLMLVGWKQTAAIASISKLACLRPADLKKRFKHFYDHDGEVLVTDSKSRSRDGDANGRCIVKKHMRRALPRLIKSEILDKNIPLTSMAVGGLISTTYFEGESAISERQVRKIMCGLGYEWGNLRSAMSRHRRGKPGLVASSRSMPPP